MTSLTKIFFLLPHYNNKNNNSKQSVSHNVDVWYFRINYKSLQIYFIVLIFLSFFLYGDIHSLILTDIVKLAIISFVQRKLVDCFICKEQLTNASIHSKKVKER